MNPLTLAKCWKLLHEQGRLIVTLSQIIADQHQGLRIAQLEHARELEGMVAGWLINLEEPEIDVRQDLSALQEDLRNRVASLEEHIL